MYILKVLDDLHTLIYVRPLNEWQNPKLRHFEIGMVKIFYQYVVPLSPPDSLNVENRKIGNFSFLNPISGAQRTCQPNYFLLGGVGGVKLLYLQFKLLAQRGHAHFEGLKSAKK